ncbi:MAG: right-handed parallel beta-helix repeat-containing protein [Ignavibacteriales bacterium]
MKSLRGGMLRKAVIYAGPILLALAMVALFGYPALAQPDDVWVEETVAGDVYHYESLTEAIDVVAPEGTIYIGEGVFTEAGQIHISKNLTIVGAGAGNSTIKSSTDFVGAVHGDEGAWFLVDEGVNLSLSGITLDGDGRRIMTGILSHGQITIGNCEFRNIRCDEYYGVAINLHGADNSTVSDCTFINIGRIGVYTGNDSDSVTIEGNTYTGKGKDEECLDYAFEVGRDGQAIIRNNRITGNTGVAYDDSTSAGILVTTYYGDAEATITGNTISDCTTAIAVGYDDEDTSVVEVHNNRLTGNKCGVSSTKVAVDASRNWWGSASGPAEGQIDGDVDYFPWATDEACTQFANDSTNVVAVDDDWAALADYTMVEAGGKDYYIGLNAFASVADAVAAVEAGGTVDVAAGTYIEQVEIAKPLTLEGAGPDTVIKSPEVLTIGFTTSAPNKPIVYVHDATDVTIINLKIDGDGKGNANYRFDGIAYHNAGGMVENVEITGVRDTPLSGMQAGVAIYAYNDDDASRTLEVKDCEIGDFQKNGMALNGTGLTVTVTGNTVTGAGPTELIAQNGIQVAYGAVGTVTGNNVTGCHYTGSPDWSAAGILLYQPGEGTNATGNQVSQCQYGVDTDLQSSFPEVQDNTFSGNAADVHADTDGWSAPAEVDVDSQFTQEKGVALATGLIKDYNAFSSVQPAIDRIADGGTVNVSAGDYAGPINITGKSVTVKGAGKNTTIVRPASLLSTGVDHKYDSDMKVAVFVNDSTDVHVQDMTIDGNSLDANAVVFWNDSTGSLDRVEVRDTGPFGGVQTGQGIAVDAGTSGTTELTLTDCVIHSFDKNGIDIVNGNGAVTGGGNITVNVSGGSVTGRGQIDTIAQNGIVFWERAGGSVRGSVNGVAISDIGYTPGTDEACGVLLYGVKNGTVTVGNVPFTEIEQYIGLAGGTTRNLSVNTCTFDSIVPGSASAAELAAIEDRIIHVMDDPDVGTIYIVPDTIVVTQKNRGIQAAIDAASPGDRIEVTSGTYSEQVTLNKSVKVHGAGTGATSLRGAGSGAGLTIPYAGQPFTGIEITGLTIEGYEDGILILGTNSDLLVEDVRIVENARHGIWSQAWDVEDWTFRRIDASNNRGSVGRGIWIINGEKENITIEDSTFTNNGLVGIDISDGSVTGLTVRDNTVTGNGDCGIAVLGAEGPGATVIDGNTVTNNGRFGIEIKNPSGSGQSSGPGSIVVTNNVVSRTAEATDVRDHAGIAVFRRLPVSQYNADQPAGVVISGNTVTGFRREPSGSTGDGFGIVVEGLNQTVTGNTVSDNDIGIQAQAGNPTPNQQSTDYFDRGDAAEFSGRINQNTITDNTIGVRNTGVAAQIDATLNYWGEPGPGGLVSGDVDVYPFYIDEEMTKENNVATSTIVVDDDWTDKPMNAKVMFDGKDYYIGLNAFPTIQNGINAAESGGEVNVAPGTYNEALVISKPLTLRSAAGAASTILDGNHAGERYYMVNIKADDVTVDGFTITNSLYSGTADASGVLIGSEGKNSNIRVMNCVIHDIGTPTRTPVSFGTFGINVGPVDGLEIDHNTIYNIRNGGADPDDYAMGIFTWGNDEIDTTNNVNIHDNTVYDISNPGQSVGINTGYCGTNITVADNSVTVAGEAQTKFGIAVSADALGPITITGNTVEGAKTAGIRLSSPHDQTVTGNTVTGCATGILLKDTSGAATIRENTISGNTLSGMENLSTTIADATLNYWGSDKGPEHESNPAGDGDTVAGKVRYSPWVTGDGNEAALPLDLAGVYDRENDEADITVAGPADPTLHSVKVNGREVGPVPVITDGAFSIKLEEGANDIWAEVHDALGNAYRGTCDLTRDTTAPTTHLEPSRPADGLDGWYKGPVAPGVTLSTEAGATIHYRWNEEDWTESTENEVELTVPEGENTLEYYSEDAEGNKEPRKSSTFKVDTVAPTGSITINSGYSSTTSRDVTLTLSSADAVSMRVSNEPGMGDAEWASFASSRPWTMLEGYGPKVVYAQFRDQAGNESVIYSDSITLERRTGGGGGGGGTTPPPVQPPVVAGSTTEEVGKETGGTVALPDNSAAVTLPPAAVAEDVKVTIAPVTEVTQPTQGMVKIGNKIYEITIEKPDGGKVTSFSKPITLTFQYSDEELAGTSPEDLKVFYWDEAAGAWVAIPSTVDPVTKTVVGTTDHLTVFALMAKPGMPAMPDIKGHWAEGPVLKLVSLGVVGGYGDGTFKPEVTITREQFAKMIVLATGIQPESAPALTFADNGSISEWARGYVAAAVKAGIIKGLDGNRFGPAEPVTRSQVATMLIRALGVQAQATSTTFADNAEIPSWAVGSVQAAVEKGIVGGFDDNTFKPGLSATRAQAAKMLSQFMSVRLSR